MQTGSISSVRLQNGETVSLGSLEITSIPHLSILGSGKTMNETIVQYKQEFLSVLNEIYLIYRSSAYKQDIALECLWLTAPVANQPYAASIRLVLIARSISQSESEASGTVNEILSQFRSALTLQKYGFRSLPYDELSQLIASVDDGSIVAVTKDETIENIQSRLIPYCFAYDRFPPVASDFRSLINALIEHPNCAISFQLIPAVFKQEESVVIDHMTQTLETMCNGVLDQSVGHLSFALAEKHAKTYRYYSDKKKSGLFAFNILIYGDPDSAAKISKKVHSQLSVAEGQTANLITVPLSRDAIRKDKNFYPLPWAANEMLLCRERDPRIWKTGAVSPACYRLPYVITAEEASEFFRLPVGSDQISAGLPVNEAARTAKTFNDNIINAGDITVGTLKSSSNGDTIGLSKNDLAKHMLVVGTPGSGKTTFSVGLLDRLWKDHEIPFLVIEPAKNEYRALVQSIPDLQVFTPGKNFISPFVFNPFVPPKNVKLETYKSTLKTAFAAAVSMSTPLDKIFEESINNCYSDFRWLDSYTVDDKGKIFNISDFIRCFQQTFDAIGYTGDAKNIGRAGVVRLNSLINLFDNYFSIPIEDLLKKPTVIELAAIENADEKALIIALLLLSILAYVNANYVGEGGLKNVILLEEAHVLLDASSHNGQGEANPSAIAQSLVKRMLAEIRSYGVGLVIADQSPRKVSTDVVALTDVKVVFRLVESEDKQIIGDSTNMTDSQIQRMARLKPGEAFLFFNKLDEPEEVVTPDYRLENKISITLSDDGIKQLSTYWKNKTEMLRPYPQCQLCAACQQSCDYGRRLLAREVARRIFVRNFNADMKEFTSVEKVFGKISSLVKAELNNEPFTPELVTCVKVHLWRRIFYGTKIPVKEIQIENSLKKSNR